MSELVSEMERSFQELRNGSMAINTICWEESANVFKITFSRIPDLESEVVIPRSPKMSLVLRNVSIESISLIGVGFISGMVS